MAYNKRMCLLLAGYMIGGFLCKPDKPTEYWSIGFVLLIIAILIATAFKQEEEPNGDRE